MQRRNHFGRAAFALAAALVAAPFCVAQTTGYITGTSSLTSFSTATGALLNSFESGGAGTAFAVASDDTTLYVPTDPENDAGMLNVISGLSGQTLGALALGQGATRVLLSSDGATAYVNAEGFGGGHGGPNDVGEVEVVNTATLAVTGEITIRSGLTIEDIALSPDNTTLYVSVSCIKDQTTCAKTGGACPVLTGICIFDASTLALKGEVEKVSGYLAVSQDNRSLYITLQNSNSGGLYIVNTSTLAVTSRAFPYPAYGRAVVSPVGKYAIIFTSGNADSSSTAYILNTSTNKIVSELFVDAPGGSQVGGGSIGYSAPAAFAPDGKSVWMVLTCGSPACTVEAPSVGGVSFPSGELISITPVAADAQTIAFPQ